MQLKKRFIPHIEDDEAEKSREEFDNLISKSIENKTTNNIVEAKIIDIKEDVVIVDAGPLVKSEGVIPKSEFEVDKDSKEPAIGDMVEVHIDRKGKDVRISRIKAIKERVWGELKEAEEKNELVNGKIFSRVKGGFAVNIKGIIAFLPGSQIDIRPTSNEDIALLIGIEQPFKILKMNEKLGNIVISRKAVLEEKRLNSKQEILNKVKEGDIVDGVVKNITDYGAFVDLGSIDGLLHITDISWTRINHPLEVLKLGQKLKVQIIKIDQEKNRLHLGLKQLEKNPWEDIMKEYKLNEVYTGKISNVSDYGIFVELKNGIEGLVYISEVTWSKSIQNPARLFSIGQEVQFMVIEADEEKKKLSLSIKRCKPNPWQTFAKNNPVGTVIKAPIRHIITKGIFVALDDEIDGMIQENDMSWTQKGDQLIKSYSKGDEIECKVLSIDVEKEKILLGIKQLTEDPFKGIIDTVVDCSILEVLDKGIKVSFSDGKYKGFIKKSEFLKDKSPGIGVNIKAKVLAFNKDKSTFLLSVET